MRVACRFVIDSSDWWPRKNNLSIYQKINFHHQKLQSGVKRLHKTQHLSWFAEAGRSASFGTCADTLWNEKHSSLECHALKVRNKRGSLRSYSHQSLLSNWIPVQSLACIFTRSCVDLFICMLLDSKFQATMDILDATLGPLTSALAPLQRLVPRLPRFQEGKSVQNKCDTKETVSLTTINFEDFFLRNTMPFVVGGLLGCRTPRQRGANVYLQASKAKSLHACSRFEVNIQCKWTVFILPKNIQRTPCR